MKRVFMALALAFATARVAAAQDQGKVGLTMGYPSSVGVIWQAADRVALRPEISLSHVTGDSASSDFLGPQPLSTNDSTGVGVGLSALFYLHRWDGLRTYVSPRFAYARTTTSATTSSATSTSESTASSYLVSGAFGAQYALGRHFGLFGEVGFGYTRISADVTSTLTIGSFGTQTTTTQMLRSSATSNTLTTRSGAGVIFFF